jgi:hypothetical protein
MLGAWREFKGHPTEVLVLMQIRMVLKFPRDPSRPSYASASFLGFLSAVMFREDAHDN